jgi:hypothetical protein
MSLEDSSHTQWTTLKKRYAYTYNVTIWIGVTILNITCFRRLMPSQTIRRSVLPPTYNSHCDRNSAANCLPLSIRCLHIILLSKIKLTQTWTSYHLLNCLHITTTQWTPEQRLHRKLFNCHEYVHTVLWRKRMFCTISFLNNMYIYIHNIFNICTIRKVFKLKNWINESVFLKGS